MKYFFLIEKSNIYCIIIHKRIRKDYQLTPITFFVPFVVFMILIPLSPHLLPLIFTPIILYVDLVASSLFISLIAVDKSNDME